MPHVWGLPWGSVKALCPPPNPLGALTALPASKSGVTPPGMALEKGHAERGEITRVGEQMGNRPLVWRRGTAMRPPWETAWRGRPRPRTFKTLREN